MNDLWDRPTQRRVSVSKSGALHDRAAHRDFIDIHFLDDSTFGEFGMSENDITVLHRWAQAWAKMPSVTTGQLSLASVTSPISL